MTTDNPVANEHPMRGLVLGCAIVAIFAAAIAAGVCAGCATSEPSGDHSTTSLVTNAVRIIAEIAVKVRENNDSDDDGSLTPTDPIDWRYGGVRGDGAVVDSENVIGDLRISGNRLSYKWIKGDLSNWGVGRTDATAIACAFFWDEDAQVWAGGKFEWVDFSRTSRDIGNLDGYHGWRRDLFDRAKRHAFCILAPDGRRRTNLITD